MAELLRHPQSPPDVMPTVDLIDQKPKPVAGRVQTPAGSNGRWLQSTRS